VLLWGAGVRVVVDKGGETRMTLCALAGMRGWLCMWRVRGAYWEDEDGDDERWQLGEQKL
jgi:hypothetical protein